MSRTTDQRPESLASERRGFLKRVLTLATGGIALGALAPKEAEALFSLLLPRYGGNGQTTFALPDFRGRAPIHAGQGPGLTNRIVGEAGGVEAHALTVAEMPAHAHGAFARSLNGTSASPAGHVPARDPSGTPHYGPDADVLLSANAIAPAGGDQPHENMPPFLTVIFLISLQGIFPPQS